MSDVAGDGSREVQVLYTACPCHFKACQLPAARFQPLPVGHFSVKVDAARTATE